MKDTIKSKYGYSVRYAMQKCAIASHTNKIAIVYEGGREILKAELRTWQDYTEEKEGNECFCFYEKFTTEKGNEFIYWGDTEIGADYLTKIEKAVK